MPAAADRPGERSSRRTLLALAGAAAILAGCGSSSTRQGANPEFREADAEVLDGLLGVANQAIAIYARAAGLLNGAERRLARRIGTHEGSHAYALTGAIYRLGGAPTPAARTYAFGARNRLAALAVCAGIEKMSIAACIDAMPKLTDLEARATVVSIANSDAQHALLIDQARGISPFSRPSVG